MPTNRESFANSIRLYSKMGWKAIPGVVYWGIDKDGRPKREKNPLVTWTDYQDRFPTQEEIDLWCSSSIADYAGVFIVTGRYDPSLVVCGVDFDQKDGKPDFLPFVDDLTDALRTRTASGGYHYYFRHDVEIRNATDLFNGNKEGGDTTVDFRGQGGVIVVGPTPLWKNDPRTYGLAKNAVLASYETPNLCRPEDLLPLPSRFVVAMQAKETVGNEEWRKIFNGKIKEGTRHTVAMSLIAKLLSGVTDADHVKGVRDLVYAVLKTQFGIDPANDMERDKIEQMFAWVMEKEKKKRTPEYEKAKAQLKEAEFIKASEIWSQEASPVRAECRGDLVTYFDKDDKTMRISSEHFLSQPVFRRNHLLAYGKLLPTITQKKFEKYVSDIPLKQIVGQSLTLDEVLYDILEDWTMDREPLANETAAKRATKLKGYASYSEGDRTVLLFSLKSLLPELMEEGMKPKRGEITESFRSLKIGQAKTNSSNLWKYVTKPVDKDAS